MCIRDSAACCNRARRDTPPTGSPAVDLPPGRQHALTVPRWLSRRDIDRDAAGQRFHSSLPQLQVLRELPFVQREQK